MKDIVSPALAAVQAFPRGVIPVWNAIGAGIDAAAHSNTVIPDDMQIKHTKLQ